MKFIDTFTVNVQCCEHEGFQSYEKCTQNLKFEWKMCRALLWILMYSMQYILSQSFTSLMFVAVGFIEIIYQTDAPKLKFRTHDANIGCSQNTPVSSSPLLSVGLD